MSRAFVKEPDGDQVPDDRPLPVASGQPNYVTRRGLELLRQALATVVEERRAAAAASPRDKAALAAVDRRARFLEQRVASAMVVDGAAGDPDEVRFGACVTVLDEAGDARTFRIVGEDEADPASQRISWLAPLSRAVLGAHTGDVVTWDRPDGPVELEVTEIAYGDE